MHDSFIVGGFTIMIIEDTDGICVQSVDSGEVCVGIVVFQLVPLWILDAQTIDELLDDLVEVIRVLVVQTLGEARNLELNLHQGSLLLPKWLIPPINLLWGTCSTSWRWVLNKTLRLH